MGKQPPKYRDIELHHIVTCTNRNSFFIQANMRDRGGIIIGKTFEIGKGFAKWHGAPKYLTYEVLRQLYKMRRDGKLRFEVQGRRSVFTTLPDSPPYHADVFQDWYETGQVLAGEWQG